MTTRYDLLSPRPGKDGKTNWVRVGVMFPSSKGEGFSIKLDALPLSNKDGEVWLNAMVPRDKPQDGGRAPQRQQSRSYEDELSDSVPF